MDAIGLEFQWKDLEDTQVYIGLRESRGSCGSDFLESSCQKKEAKTFQVFWANHIQTAGNII